MHFIHLYRSDIFNLLMFTPLEMTADRCILPFDVCTIVVECDLILVAGNSYLTLAEEVSYKYVLFLW